MRMTWAEFLAYNAKSGAAPMPAGEGVEKEADLHDQIIAYCKMKRWVYSHSRMDKATTTALGIPDFIIAADNGRTFWIEAKGAKTKVTREQEGMIHWLQSLGHKAAICRNFEEFLKAII